MADSNLLSPRRRMWLQTLPSLASSTPSWSGLQRLHGSSRQARQIGPPFEILKWRRFSRPGAARASCAFAWRHKTKAAVSRAAESDCQTDRTRRLSAGLMGPAGQERLFAATIGTTGFHRTGRPLEKPAATWIAGPPVLLVGKMNARRIPAERPKGLAYPLTCLLR